MFGRVLFVTISPLALPTVTCWAAFLKTILMETDLYVHNVIDLQDLLLG
jgi:hypothetical protein